MKKMLKILAMLLVIATVVFAAGCADNEPAEEAVEEEAEADVAQTAAEEEGDEAEAAQTVVEEEGDEAEAAQTVAVEEGDEAEAAKEVAEGEAPAVEGEVTAQAAPAEAAPAAEA